MEKLPSREWQLLHVSYPVSLGQTGGILLLFGACLLGVPGLSARAALGDFQ